MKFVVEKVMGVGAEEGKTILNEESRKSAASIIFVSSDEDIVKAVEANPTAIGIVDVYNITSGVKVIRIDDKQPFDPRVRLEGSLDIVTCFRTRGDMKVKSPSEICTHRCLRDGNRGSVSGRERPKVRAMPKRERTRDEIREGARNDAVAGSPGRLRDRHVAPRRSAFHGRRNRFFPTGP